MLHTRQLGDLCRRQGYVINPDVIEQTIVSFCSVRVIVSSIITDVGYRIQFIQTGIGSRCLFLAVHVDNIIAVVPGERDVIPSLSGQRFDIFVSIMRIAKA